MRKLQFYSEEAVRQNGGMAAENCSSEKRGGSSLEQENSREAYLNKIWETQDEAYDLMCEYDSLPHFYGENILYQAEGHIIDLIALHPGITVTELANILKKTASNCSQIVRKLRAKGWVEQTRNKTNNRIYNLSLTESGQHVFQDHVAFSQKCQERMFRMLESFSDTDLKKFIEIQKMVIESYKADICESRESYS